MATNQLRVMGWSSKWEFPTNKPNHHFLSLAKLLGGGGYRCQIYNLAHRIHVCYLPTCAIKNQPFMQANIPVPWILWVLGSYGYSNPVTRKTLILKFLSKLLAHDKDHAMPRPAFFPHPESIWATKQNWPYFPLNPGCSRGILTSIGLLRSP